MNFARGSIVFVIIASVCSSGLRAASAAKATARPTSPKPSTTKPTRAPTTREPITTPKPSTHKPTRAPTSTGNKPTKEPTNRPIADCSTEKYYGGLLSDGGTSLRDDVTRSELEGLMTSTHGRVLPYTSSTGGDDVWKALADVDAGRESPDTVRLIYKQVDVPSMPRGTSDTWNREHLWPSSRGVGSSGADYTDVHHLRPADWNVNSARGNSFFGECGSMAPRAACVSPAHVEAANDTAKDGTIFRPPASVRGDIARAAFYMDVRYSAQNNNGVDLVLTDCPSANSTNEMAYKSQLLAWHAEDTVSDEERMRNRRVCERWQGNRNVFVDFPDAARRIFGEPRLPIGDGLGYAECTAA